MRVVVVLVLVCAVSASDVTAKREYEAAEEAATFLDTIAPSQKKLGLLNSEMDVMDSRVNAANRDPEIFAPPNIPLQPLKLNALGWCDDKGNPESMQSETQKCLVNKAALDAIKKQHNRDKKKWMKSFRSEVLPARRKTIQVPRRMSAVFEEDEPLTEVSKDAIRITKTKLGEGGFKSVYKARYDHQDVAVAVISSKYGVGKVMTAKEVAMINAEIFISNAVREKTTATDGTVRHVCRKFVPRLIAFAEERDTGWFSSRGLITYYLVMELAAGSLQNKDYSKSKFQAIGVALQMLMGLHCVHMAGYIHKDIKEGNYLVSKKGDTIMINDFGLTAKMVDEPTKLATRSGTPGYMATESAATSLERYDMFSLGVAFEELNLRKILPANLVHNMKHATYGNRPTPMAAITQIADMLLKPLKDEIDSVNVAIAEAQRDYENAVDFVFTHRKKQAALEAQRNLALRWQEDARRITAQVAQVAERHTVAKEKLIRQQEQVRVAASKLENLKLQLQMAADAAANSKRQVVLATRTVYDAASRVSKARERVDSASRVGLDPHGKMYRKVFGPTPGTLPKRPLAQLRRDAADELTVAQRVHDGFYRQYQSAVSVSEAADREHTRLSTVLTPQIAASTRTLEVARHHENMVRSEEEMLRSELARQKTEEERVAQQMRTLETVTQDLILLRGTIDRAVNAQNQFATNKSNMEAKVAALKAKHKELKDRLTMDRYPDIPIATLMTNTPLM